MYCITNNEIIIIMHNLYVHVKFMCMCIHNETNEIYNA